MQPNTHDVLSNRCVFGVHSGDRHDVPLVCTGTYVSPQHFLHHLDISASLSDYQCFSPPKSELPENNFSFSNSFFPLLNTNRICKLLLPENRWMLASWLRDSWASMWYSSAGVPLEGMISSLLCYTSVYLYIYLLVLVKII